MEFFHRFFKRPTDEETSNLISERIINYKKNNNKPISPYDCIYKNPTCCNQFTGVEKTKCENPYITFRKKLIDKNIKLHCNLDNVNKRIKVNYIIDYINNGKKNLEYVKKFCKGNKTYGASDNQKKYKYLLEEFIPNIIENKNNLTEDKVREELEKEKNDLYINIFLQLICLTNNFSIDALKQISIQNEVNQQFLRKVYNTTVTKYTTTTQNKLLRHECNDVIDKWDLLDKGTKTKFLNNFYRDDISPKHHSLTTDCQDKLQNDLGISPIKQGQQDQDDIPSSPEQDQDDDIPTYTVPSSPEQNQQDQDDIPSLPEQNQQDQDDIPSLPEQIDNELMDFDFDESQFNPDVTQYFDENFPIETDESTDTKKYDYMYDEPNDLPSRFYDSDDDIPQTKKRKVDINEKDLPSWFF